MAGIKVRRATAEDASAMMATHISCLNTVYAEHYTETALSMWESLLHLDYYVAKTQTSGWCYVAVLENTEEIVGFGYLNTNESHPPRIPEQFNCSLHIDSLYISPRHQSCGIGQKLMKAIELKARSENCRELWVLSSSVAVPFYQKLGYTSIIEDSWFDIHSNTYQQSEYSVNIGVLVKNLSKI